MKNRPRRTRNPPRGRRTLGDRFLPGKTLGRDRDLPLVECTSAELRLRLFRLTVVEPGILTQAPISLDTGSHALKPSQ